MFDFELFAAVLDFLFNFHMAFESHTGHFPFLPYNLVKASNRMILPASTSTGLETQN